MPIPLQISKLKIAYKKQLLFSDFSTDAHAGELIALLGMNGAGKSSLLRVLAGLQKQTSGDIKFFAKPNTEYTIKELAKTVSFVSTEQILMPYLTVRELVMLGRFPHHNFLQQPDYDESAEQAMQKTGVIQFADKQLSQLSDGERQKAMIARALAQDTPVIILDEPAAFLDMHAKFQLYNLMRKLADAEQKTIIISTHDINEIFELADKVWLIKNGEILSKNRMQIIDNQLFGDFFKGVKLDYNPVKKRFEFL